MREMALWVFGAVLAFLVTAGAFLLLANLATVPSEKSLAPDPASAESGPALELVLDEERLASLRSLPAQDLDLMVKNAGATNLSDVNVTLSVSSENTALSEPRYYRRTVEEIPAGGAANVRFEFDLSAPDERPAAVPEPSRKVLEVRATAPEGISTVRTVILPPQSRDRT